MLQCHSHNPNLNPLPNTFPLIQLNHLSELLVIPAWVLPCHHSQLLQCWSVQPNCQLATPLSSVSFHPCPSSDSIARSMQSAILLWLSPSPRLFVTKATNLNMLDPHRQRPSYQSSPWMPLCTLFPNSADGNSRPSKLLRCTHNSEFQCSAPSP